MHPKTINPYYHMLDSEFISQGIDLKFLTDFKSIENVIKQESKCILHLHQIEQFYHLDDDETATLLNSRKFLDNLKRMKTLGAKLVWTMHNPVPHDRKFQKIDEKVNQELFSLSDHIIVLGTYPKLTLSKDQEVSTPISVIMHPSFREVYPLKMDKIQARKELELPLDAIIFGNIASIRPYKGHEFIIDAFKEVLKRQNSNKKLFLLIAGFPGGEDYITSLRERCDSNLIIMDKYLTETDLIRLVSALDYSVFAFKDIWASSSVILSLSFQVPVIVPDKGCMFEYVHHRDNGLLYKHDNLHSLIEVLDFATQLKHYKHMQYMSGVYLKEYTISNAAGKFIKVYEKVLGFI